MKKGRLGAGAFKVERSWLEGKEQSCQLTGWQWAEACVQSAVYTCVSLWNPWHVGFCIDLQPVHDNNPPSILCSQKETWPQSLYSKYKGHALGEAKKKKRGQKWLRLVAKSCKNELAFLACKVCKECVSVWERLSLIGSLFKNILFNRHWGFCFIL